MTQHAINYAKVLFDLYIPEESIHNMAQLVLGNRELIEALSNPAIKKNEKGNVIDVVFDEEVRSFLKVLCDNECFEIIDEILEAYNAILLDSKNIIKATITFVTRPDDDQLEKIKEMVCKKYNKSGVLLELKEDSSLLGGFILSVGDMVYDKSILGTLSNLHKTLVWR
jgi:F-type H+-transporting ATPase subunit delta